MYIMRVEEYLDLLESGVSDSKVIKLIERDYGIKCEEMQSGGKLLKKKDNINYIKYMDLTNFVLKAIKQYLKDNKIKAVGTSKLGMKDVKKTIQKYNIDETKLFNIYIEILEKDLKEQEKELDEYEEVGKYNSKYSKEQYKKRVAEDKYNIKNYKGTIQFLKEEIKKLKSISQ